METLSHRISSRQFKQETVLLVEQGNKPLQQIAHTLEETEQEEAQEQRTEAQGVPGSSSMNGMHRSNDAPFS